MDEERPRISIILPCFNEEKAIVGVVNSIREVMDRTDYPYEILVVDDASTDNTVRIVKDLGVDLINRKRRGGSGAARKVGIKAAKADIIVMLDCDGSYAASDIPKLLEYIPEYDQVIGWRKGEKGTFKFLRFSAKWIICKLASYLAKTDIADLNSGIRAFKKELLLEYLWVIPDGFSCVSSMTLAFLCNNLSVKWIPVQYHKRIGHSKFHPVNDTLNYIITVIRIITYFEPLRIFVPLSLFLFTVGILKTINDIFLNLLPDSVYIDITLILVSIIVFFLGLIAELIIISRKR